MRTSICLLLHNDSEKCGILEYVDLGGAYQPPNLNSGKIFAMCA